MLTVIGGTFYEGQPYARDAQGVIHRLDCPEIAGADIDHVVASEIDEGAAHCAVCNPEIT